MESVCDTFFFVIIDIPHNLSRERWLLKCKMCTVSKLFGKFCWKYFLSWVEWYLRSWFIYREALPSKPQFTTPQKFSWACSLCQCSSSPRSPMCRRSSSLSSQIPGSPQAHRILEAVGMIVYQAAPATGTVHTDTDSSLWSTCLERQEEDRPSLGRGFSNHSSSPLHLNHSPSSQCPDTMSWRSLPISQGSSLFTVSFSIAHLFPHNRKRTNRVFASPGSSLPQGMPST